MAWADRPYNDSYHDTQGFGGRLRMMSVVTWLIIINAAVYVLDTVLSGSMRGSAVVPHDWLNFNVDQAIEHVQLWRAVTYTFVHGGIFHIFFNMLALYFFGPMVESVLGGKRFLAFYLLCGAAGAALFTVLVYALPGLMFPAGMPAHWAQLIGASGCVMGVLIAGAMIAPDQQVMLLFPPIPMKLRTMAIVFVAIDFLAVAVGGSNAGGSVAHLGGAAFGFVLFKYRSVLGAVDRVGAIGDLGQKWKQHQTERQHQRQEQIDREVDRILAKVSEQGLQSLTDKEKRTLKRATESKRGGGGN